MPVESFWESKDLIPVAQKKVSVPAEFGLNYSAGQKILIHVPPSIDFFQPKETYLKFDVEISGASDFGTRRMFLDAETGGQVLIRDLRIYSGGAGRILLEEYQNYNVWTAMKYDYETNDNIKKKRSLTEGTQLYDPACRSTHGTKRTDANSCRNNPYFENDGVSETTDSASHTDTERQKVKCLLPLNSGIFQSERVFPNMLTEGLVLEIILEDNTNVFRQLDTTLQFREQLSCPVFQSVDGSACNTTGKVSSSLTHATENGSFTTFYLRRDNQQGAGGVVGNCPFVVGQNVVFASAGESASIVASGFGSGANGSQVHITQIEVDTTTDPDMLKVTLSAPMKSITGADINVNKAVLCQDPRTTAYAPTYTISDTELIVQQVMMPDGFKARMMGMLKEGGTLNYDFLSHTNYKFSQLAGDLVSNIRLPVNESRAKSIFMIPTDATSYSKEQSMNASGTYFIEYGGEKYQDKYVIRSTRSGLVGIADRLNNYQVLYDGKLNPTRPVSCSRTSDRISIDQQPIIELEKALAMGGVRPLSFAKYRENFVVGRALTLQDGAVDLRGRDFSLQVMYDSALAGYDAKNKLWMNWVAHLRRIVVKGDSIMLEI
jgi:hypothetical protein